MVQIAFACTLCANGAALRQVNLENDMIKKTLQTKHYTTFAIEDELEQFCVKQSAKRAFCRGDVHLNMLISDLNVHQPACLGSLVCDRFVPALVWLMGLSYAKIRAVLFRSMAGVC
jgi:hypothetical protein